MDDVFGLLGVCQFLVCVVCFLQINFVIVGCKTYLIFICSTFRNNNWDLPSSMPREDQIKARKLGFVERVLF